MQWRFKYFAAWKSWSTRCWPQPRILGKRIIKYIFSLEKKKKSNRTSKIAQKLFPLKTTCLFLIVSILFKNFLSMVCENIKLGGGWFLLKNLSPFSFFDVENLLLFTKFVFLSKFLFFLPLWLIYSSFILFSIYMPLAKVFERKNSYAVSYSYRIIIEKGKKIHCHYYNGNRFHFIFQMYRFRIWKQNFQIS